MIAWLTTVALIPLLLYHDKRVAVLAFCIMAINVIKFSREL